MSLPPLANLFAVRHADPGVLERLAARLEARGEFASVWRPVPGWVVASAPLPGGAPDDEAVRSRGLAFVEGRENVAPSNRGDRDLALDRVRDLARETPDELASLPGDFGLLHVAPDGSATLVRSCGGLVPLYFRETDRYSAVGSRLADFVRFLPDSFSLDPLVSAIWAHRFPVFPDCRTFLKGVTILDRGCYVRLGSGHPDAGQRSPGTAGAPRRYWHPRPKCLERPTPAVEREHVERLRHLLIERLARDLDPAGGNLLTLSGGVDSSALGALAAGPAGRPVWTWTWMPPDEANYRRETEFIEPLCRQFGFGRRWETRSDETPYLEILRRAPPVMFAVVHPALCALPGIVREAPVRVLFGGEYADEVCGSLVTLPDWAQHTSLPELLTSLGEMPVGPRDALRWVKFRVGALVKRPTVPFPPELAEYVHAGVREEYREWRDRRRRRAAGDRGPRRYLTLRGELDGYVAMNWEAASFLGIRRSLPFFNRELLELSWECHPCELVGPGTKKLLRAALRDDVPPKNLYRGDKGHWGAVRGSVRWKTPLPDLLHPIVDDGWLPRPEEAVSASDAAGLTVLEVLAGTFRKHRADNPDAG